MSTDLDGGHHHYHRGASHLYSRGLWEGRDARSEAGDSFSGEGGGEDGGFADLKRSLSLASSESYFEIPATPRRASFSSPRQYLLDHGRGKGVGLASGPRGGGGDGGGVETGGSRDGPVSSSPGHQGDNRKEGDGVSRRGGPGRGMSSSSSGVRGGSRRKVLRKEREGELYLMFFNACREMYHRLYHKNCIGGSALLSLNTSLDLSNDFAVGKVRQNPIRAWAEVLQEDEHLQGGEGKKKQSGHKKRTLQLVKDTAQKGLILEEDKEKLLRILDEQQFRLSRFRPCFIFIRPQNCVPSGVGGVLGFGGGGRSSFMESEVLHSSQDHHANHQEAHLLVQEQPHATHRLSRGGGMESFALASDRAGEGETVVIGEDQQLHHRERDVAQNASSAVHGEGGRRAEEPSHYVENDTRASAQQEDVRGGFTHGPKSGEEMNGNRADERRNSHTRGEGQEGAQEEGEQDGSMREQWPLSEDWSSEEGEVDYNEEELNGGVYGERRRRPTSVVRMMDSGRHGKSPPPLPRFFLEEELRAYVQKEKEERMRAESLELIDEKRGERKERTRDSHGGRSKSYTSGTGGYGSSHGSLTGGEMDRFLV
ncbi:na+ h+ exchanger [Cystoisospora suis]|uniref:Na+ h+ exchanger n=1 Tax=Cystoisospora suis TaxID=483139 RepID=A0A2C6L731_9APIC|nr:na+ h+ exchanger [Cystoisospora suis]